MKPGVNRVRNKGSNNVHVSVIDFVIVPIWGLLLFLQEYLLDHHSMSCTGMLQRHTVNSQLSAVDSFPALNACTCNAVKMPIMSMKCCEKSYVSCRPYCVGWRKYLNCSDAFTRSWHTDMHLLYFCTPDVIIWGLGSKVKVAYKILVLFIVNIIQAEML